MAFKVCPDCGGHGTKDNLGAFTSDDLDREYGQGPERDEFLRDYKAGMYDKTCSFCSGEKVVTDERYGEWEDTLTMRREIEMEQRFGA